MPRGAWVLSWLGAIVVAVALVAASESYLRSLGHRPSVPDDPARWSLVRRSVDDDRGAIAFVGTSRMQLAVSLDVARAALPGHHHVQLAIDGVPALGVLADLASDTHFVGTAIVDVDEWDIAFGDALAMAVPYVAHARTTWRSPGAFANRMLGTVPQEHLAALAVGGRRLLLDLLRGRAPKPMWVATDRDRVGHANYSLATTEALQMKAHKRYALFDKPRPDPAAWLQSAATLLAYAQTIEKRGGHVVFVRLPISGHLEELFVQHYPRAEYWNAFAARATRAAHYEDSAAVRNIDCPDEMHVDERDQAVVTEWLVSLLSLPSS